MNGGTEKREWAIWLVNASTTVRCIASEIFYRRAQQY